MTQEVLTKAHWRSWLDHPCTKFVQGKAEAEVAKARKELENSDLDLVGFKARQMFLKMVTQWYEMPDMKLMAAIHRERKNNNDKMEVF